MKIYYDYTVTELSNGKHRIDIYKKQPFTKKKLFKWFFWDTKPNELDVLHAVNQKLKNVPSEISFWKALKTACSDFWYDYFNMFECQNPFKTYMKVKKFMKPCRLNFYGGWTKDWSTTEFDIVAYEGKISPILYVHSNDVDYSWKYDNLRYNSAPQVFVLLFNHLYFGFILSPKTDKNKYWEQALHLMYECDMDVEKARKTFWLSYDKNSNSWTSSWDDKLLK